MTTPLGDRLDRQARPWRVGLAQFGAFGALALLIGAVGLYSVVAYTTSQRAHEIGVRIALGARATDVLRLVVSNGPAIAAIGIALGVLLVLAAGPRLEPLLFETSPRSPVVFAAVIGVLLASALLATILPARGPATVTAPSSSGGPARHASSA